VFECTGSAAPQRAQWFNANVAGTCAHVVASVPNASCYVGAPGNCVGTGWWVADAAAASAPAQIVVGFGAAVFASHVLVLESRLVGFVVLVEVLDADSGRWLAGFNGTERDRASGDAVRVAAFPVPNHVRTARVRITAALHSPYDQINGIALVGALLAPAPTPATGAPTPYPTPAPPPRVCPPPYRSQNDETKYLMLGDEWCTLDNVCLFPCRVPRCSYEGFDSVPDCDELLDSTQASSWIDYDDDPYYFDWVELDFGAEITAYALAIEQSEPTPGRPVLEIASLVDGSVLWSNATNSEVRASDYNPTLALYVFSEPVNVSAVNLTIWPYYGFSVAFVRLVGHPLAPVARRRAERRLGGRFLVNEVPLAEHLDDVTSAPVGRFDIMAPNAPPPYLKGQYWLAPGRYLANRQYLSSVEYWFDLCGTTPGGFAMLPCESWDSYPVTDDGHPLPTALIHVQGSLVNSINMSVPHTVAVWTGGWSSTFHDATPFQYRTTTTDWTRLPVAVPRAFGCGMALDNTVYYAGGLATDGSGTLLASIESWVFVGGTGGTRVVPVNRTLTVGLSEARASPGCAVLGDHELVIVGGWLRNVTIDRPKASDAFEIVDLGGNGRVQSGRLPIAVVAPSVAAVHDTIVVVSGAPVARYDANAFVPYNAYELAKQTGGVAIYDRTARQWQVLNVLSPLAYNAGEDVPWPSLRIAVPFNYDFIAVVGGEAFDEHDGSIDPTRVGKPGHNHPIDLYHAVEKRWYLNVAQHHAGLSFSVISALDATRLTVVGGQFADGYSQPFNTMTLLDWEYIERFECENIVDNCIGCFEDETPFERCAICAGGSCVKAKGGVCPIGEAVLPNCSANGTPTATTTTTTDTTDTSDSTDTDSNGSGGSTGTDGTSASESGANATSASTNSTNAQQRGSDAGGKNTVLIAVLASLGGLLLLALIGGGVWFAVRRRRAAEAQKKGEVPLAGVGTAVESGTKKRGGSDESESASDDDGGSGLLAAPPIVPSASVADVIDHKYVINSAELKRGKKLGEGAFGEVYQAKWRNTKVAVKEIRMRVADDKKQIASFEQEMTAMCRLQPHSNVIQLYGVVIGEQLAIVTEFAPFGSLDDWLESPAGKSASTSALMTIASECSAGLAHLHAQKVIHRDVAARNVLLGVGFVAKIADFGLSRSVSGEDSDDEGKTVQAVGPLRWMSPESMRQKVYSQYTDAFSFGVLLYEVFERKLPWEGLSITEAAAEVLGGKRLQLSRKNPAPDVVREVMADCFRTEPKDRPTLANACERLTNAANEADSASGDEAPTATGEYSAPPSVASGRYTETPSINPKGYDSIPPEDKDDDDDDDDSASNSSGSSGGAGKGKPLKSDTQYSLAPPAKSDDDSS
jgi:serine/threonine protein kinase